jgi:hypothetical protein
VKLNATLVWGNHGQEGMESTTRYRVWNHTICVGPHGFWNLSENLVKHPVLLAFRDSDRAEEGLMASEVVFPGFGPHSAKTHRSRRVESHRLFLCRASERCWAP